MTFSAEAISCRPGTTRFACPACDRGPADKALVVTVRDSGDIVWYCHRCGLRGSESNRWQHPISKRLPNSSRPSADDDRAQAASWQRLKTIWSQSRAIEPGDAAARYLDGRGCARPPERSDLRWHPELRHPSGWVGPALVARITHAITGEPLTLHRTWLDPKGNGKAAVEPVRLLMKGLGKRLGVVRIWPDETVTTGLAVSEGIETALTAALGFTPVWSCIDAGNLGAIPLLAGVEALTVVIDHDAAGIRAWNHVASSWRSAGREVRRWMPARPGLDLNDLHGGRKDATG